MRAVVIPCRGGSKRIPKKNLVDLNGKPLMSYAIQSSLEITGEVYVSTDCPEIERVAIDYGAKIIKRPDAISTDFCKTNAAIEHFLEEVDNVDIFACVQATTPLMQPSYLKEAFNKVRSGDFDSAISVCESKKFYWTGEGQPVGFSVKHRPRTQDMDKRYSENGAFYVTTRESFFKNESLMGGKVGLVVTPQIISLEIDDWDDLRLVRALATGGLR